MHIGYDANERDLAELDELREVLRCRTKSQALRQAVEIALTTLKFKAKVENPGPVLDKPA